MSIYEEDGDRYDGRARDILLLPRTLRASKKAKHTTANFDVPLVRTQTLTKTKPNRDKRHKLGLGPEELIVPLMKSQNLSWKDDVEWLVYTIADLLVVYLRTFTVS